LFFWRDNCLFSTYASVSSVNHARLRKPTWERFHACFVLKEGEWYQREDAMEIEVLIEDNVPYSLSEYSFEIVHESYPWHRKRDGTGWQHEQVEGDNNPTSEKPCGLTWENLTYQDWVTILSSLLLVSHNPNFYERFGNEKIRLEFLLQRHSLFANGLATRKTYAEQVALFNVPIMTDGDYVDGTFVPNDPLMYSYVYQIFNPQVVSDPSHWGHLVWKCCNQMD
jgi:hypothetical protein